MMAGYLSAGITTRGSTGKILYCLSNQEEINWGTNYMANAYLGMYDSESAGYYPASAWYGPRKLQKCRRPSMCAIVIDGKSKTAAGGRLDFDFTNQSNAQNYVDLRHSGGINVLFADGHVAWEDFLQKSDDYIYDVYHWGSGWKYWPY